MDQFYTIAGLTVKMNSFGRTVEQAKPYVANEATPDICIPCTWHQLKLRQPHLSDDDCEYLSTGASFYTELLRFDGMMLHSSAVVMDGKAYLFSAPCGTGKSTHTNLWLDVFGSRAAMLNDDKPALRYEDGTWYAYGTPWSGKHDISANLRVPVAGIAMVERGEHNEITRLDSKAAIYGLLDQTIRPKNIQMYTKLLELLDSLITNIPVWKIKCNMDREAAVVAYEAMSGEKWRN